MIILLQISFGGFMVGISVHTILFVSFNNTGTKWLPIIIVDSSKFYVPSRISPTYTEPNFFV